MGAGTLMHPGRHPCRGFRAPPQRHAFEQARIFVPTVPGAGPAGAAMFALALDAGAKVTFSWSTDIFRSYSGNEQRSSPFGSPRRRFEGTAFVIGDAADRVLRSALQRSAARGATFLLALPFEELLLIDDAAGMVVTVASTASCDWALPGQRAVLVGRDGTTLAVVIQSTTDTTLTLGAVDGLGNLVTVP